MLSQHDESPSNLLLLVNSQLENIQVGQRRLEAHILKIQQDVLQLSSQDGGKRGRASTPNLDENCETLEEETENKTFPCLQLPSAKGRSSSKSCLLNLRSMPSDSSVASINTSRSNSPTRAFEFKPIKRRNGFARLSTSTSLDGEVQYLSEQYLTTRSSVQSRRHSLTGITAEERANLIRLYRKKSAVGPIHPDAMVTIGFDILSSLVLTLEAFLVPFQMSFEENSMLSVNVSIATFWTVDLFLGFATGFYHKDELIMDFGKIARHYLRGYFFLALAVVAVDWFAIACEVILTDADSARPHAQITFIKVLRVCKLFRVLRLAEKFIRLQATGWYNRLYRKVIMQRRDLAQLMLYVMKIGKLLLGVIWINHLGSCIWHVVGKQALGVWHDNNIAGGGGGVENGYWLSFYWSISLMASGSSFINPMSTGDLLFAVCYTLFGLIFGSCLVSSVAAMLLDMQMSNQVYEADLRRLKDFLNQHGIQPGLWRTTVEQANARVLSQQNRMLTEKDVPIFHLLSSSVRSEIAKCRHGPILLKTRTFMRACAAFDSTFFKDVCALALTSHVIEPGELVFDSHTDAKFAYILQSGSLEYTPSSEVSNCFLPSNLTPPSAKVSIEAGQWVAEATLFTYWTHRGRLEVATPSELLHMSPEAFIDVLARCNVRGSRSPEVRSTPSMQAQSVHATVGSLMRDYSDAFCALAAQEPAGTLTDLCSTITPESVAAAMRLRSRVAMSQVAFDVLVEHLGLTRIITDATALNDLIKEISTGQCTLSVESFSQEVFRVVSVVALRIYSPDDKMLVQLGTWSRKDGVSSTYQLPGTKVRSGEKARDALHRLLSGWLNPLGISGDLADAGRQVINLHSKKYEGLATRYFRINFEGSLERETDMSIPVHWKPDSAFEDTVDDRFEAFALPDVRNDGTFIICAWQSRHFYELMAASENPGLVASAWLSNISLEEDLTDWHEDDGEGLDFRGSVDDYEPGLTIRFDDTEISCDSRSSTITKASGGPVSDLPSPTGRLMLLGRLAPGLFLSPRSDGQCIV